MPIKVAVVDDSATVRKVLSEILSTHQDIEIIFSAANPVFAFRKMEKQWPDVIVSDIEMPEMDGIEFLKKVMEQRPTPFIICSTQAENLASRGVDALYLGALELIQKPQVGLSNFLNDQAQAFIDAVVAAGGANLSHIKADVSKLSVKPKSVRSAEVVTPTPAMPKASGRYSKKLIVIGSSTGGTIVLEELLSAMKGGNVPPIVIVQHMPEKFTKSFAFRLNQLSDLNVMEAVDGQILESDSVYIARGGKHLELKQSGNTLVARVTEGAPVSRHKPSVNVLFRSASKILQVDMLGIILTGMGDDGAQGLLLLKNAGARTIAQDKSSSAVWGMPKVAWQLGAAQAVLDVNGIIEWMSDFSMVRRF